MPTRFRHAAIVGKYQAQGIRPLLEEIAHFLVRLGLEVSFDAATALNIGVTDYEGLSPSEMGRRCDLAVVVGGDGTMLGIARELARHNLPLVGINQGRLGFITDVPLAHYRETLESMVAGDYEEEHRAMIEGGVWRDGEKIFDGLSLNEVVVSRGATASMVELRIDIGDEFVANLRADGLIIASPTGSTA
ncbi:MAG: NAD(+)/NADH kinase, partial [Rubrivivax sp.]